MEDIFKNFMVPCRPSGVCAAQCPTQQSECENVEPALAASRFCLMRERKDNLSLGGAKLQITVKLDQQPFGMNVKTDGVPFVVHVAPGSLAEASGVRAGDVVTSINGDPVTAQNWYDVYLVAPLPIILTLDTYGPAPAQRWDTAGVETKYVLPQAVLAEAFDPTQTTSEKSTEISLGEVDDRGSQDADIASRQPATQHEEDDESQLGIPGVLDVDAAAEQAARMPPPSSEGELVLRRCNIVRDVDAAAEEALQETQVLMELQQAQDMRRRRGLEMRELQLQQAELEVQDALQRLEQDPFDTSDLKELLAQKARRRDALAYDVSMWGSWIAQSDDLVREHINPSRMLH